METDSASRAMESASLGKLGEALAKAQGVMQAASKDSTNPHFRSSYADLASIREAIREPLSSNGLSYFQRVSSGPNGVTVETTLLHSSGEFVRDSCWLPVAQQTAQAFGSAITYARRYSLAAIVGVVADEDDDGNAASARPAPRPAAREQPRPKAAAPEPAAPLPVQDKPPAPCDHEWDLKGKCNMCGAQEPKAAAPKQSAADLALRARRLKLWKKAQDARRTLEEFQGWAALALGRAVPSAEWTDEDVGRLENALPDLLAPLPEEAGSAP